MLSFSLVAEALTGLIYHRPSGENSNFQSVTLPDDGRSISRNVAEKHDSRHDKLKNSINTTESTNTNIFKMIMQITIDLSQIFI